MVELVHWTGSGRARFRVPGLYRSTVIKHRIEVRLTTERGIRHVFANPLTGRALVLFENGGQPAEIAILIQEVLGSAPETPPRAGGVPPPSPVRRAVPRSRRRRTSRKDLLLNRFRALLGKPEKQEVRPWHVATTEEVLAHFGSSAVAGLPAEAAKQALRKYGPNLIPETAPPSRLAMLFGQFKSLPVVLLCVAAGLSAATGGVVDAAAIMVVVGLNASIGFINENGAERTIRSLRSLVKPRSQVIRDGEPRTLDLAEVVPGDLLQLRPGSYVASDSRVVSAQNLSADESILTGESIPVLKTSAPLSSEQVPLPDRRNMVYLGSRVTGGQGLAVAVATGSYTEMGRIQELLGEAAPPQTPLERQLRQLGGQLVLLTGVICGLVLAAGLMRGYRLLAMLKTSISLAIAAVPEGLPAVAMTTLAIGMRTMRRHRILIRRLEAVETLGCMQTICLDKTGTITLNRMSVVRLHAGGSVVRAGGPAENGRSHPASAGRKDLVRLLEVAALCNEAQVRPGTRGVDLEGSPTETALLRAALDWEVDVVELRRRFPVLATQHRAENINFMKTTHQRPGRQRLIAVKGSPLEVLALCQWYVKEGKARRLTDRDRREIERENDRMAADALRVLGVAYSLVGSDTGQSPEPLTWLGLCGMADPIRDGVKDLVGAFHGAGIDTVMITGDQTPTAFAVGNDLDLSRGRPLDVLDSTQLGTLDPAVLRALARRVQVFSRVSPVHKLQIVRALQQAGRVVGMSGDGINDGPALKAADIGIAMGQSGTDVARDVAGVVLENDELELLVQAVSHGRTTYANIRKSLRFLLSTNFSEVMVTFVAVAAGLGHPLTTLQLLWINLISDVFPSLALAVEPPEPAVMKQPPRDPAEPVLRSGDFARIISESAVITGGALVASGYGWSRYRGGNQTSTIGFQGLVLGQLLHALCCRSSSRSVLTASRLPANRPLGLALIGSVGLQLLTMTFPPLRRLLGLTGLGLLDALVISGTALASLAVNDLTKSPLKGRNR